MPFFDRTRIPAFCLALAAGAYSADKVLAPAFYALDKRHLPMLISLCSIAINFGLNYFFTFQLKLGHRGLATTSRYLKIATSTVCATASPLDLLPKSEPAPGTSAPSPL